MRHFRANSESPTAHELQTGIGPAFAQSVKPADTYSVCVEVGERGYLREYPNRNDILSSTSNKAVIAVTQNREGVLPADKRLNFRRLVWPYCLPVKQMRRGIPADGVSL